MVYDREARLGGYLDVTALQTIDELDRLTRGSFIGLSRGQVVGNGVAIDNRGTLSESARLHCIIDMLCTTWAVEPSIQTVGPESILSNTCMEELHPWTTCGYTIFISLMGNLELAMIANADVRRFVGSRTNKARHKHLVAPLQRHCQLPVRVLFAPRLQGLSGWHDASWVIASHLECPDRDGACFR